MQRSLPPNEMASPDLSALHASSLNDSTQESTLSNSRSLNDSPTEPTRDSTALAVQAALASKLGKRSRQRSVPHKAAALKKQLSRSSPPANKRQKIDDTQPSRSGRTRRLVFPCGTPGCQHVFPMGGNMWLLIRRDANSEEKICSADLPIIPKNHPMHLICMKCIELDGCDMMEPNAVLPEEVMAEIPGIKNYVYCPASHKDYEVNHEKDV
jgi:hypothetical protein